MRLTVRVKPNARQAKVQQLDDGSYKVSVTAVADKGKANQAVIDALAEHFKMPPSAIEIITGHTSRKKILQIQT